MLMFLILWIVSTLIATLVLVMSGSWVLALTLYVAMVVLDLLITGGKL